MKVQKMTIDIDQYKRLRARADKAKSDTDKAKGSQEQLQKKLMEDFQCISIEDAEQKHEELKFQLEELERQYDRELESFEREFREKL